MFNHIIDFVIAYFTHLNAKKIFAGILMIVGLVAVQKIASSGDINLGLMYAVGGIFIGGIGFVIAYYDIANDKTNGGYNELDTITKAYEQKKHEDIKISSWHINEDTEHSSKDKNQ